MGSTSHIQSSGSVLIESEFNKQFPELPNEILDIIFGSLKLSEIGKLVLSCRQWKVCTDPYLKLLNQEAIRLSKDMIGFSYIPSQKNRYKCGRAAVSCLILGKGIQVNRMFCVGTCKNYCSDNQLKIVKFTQNISVNQKQQISQVLQAIKKII